MHVAEIARLLDGIVEGNGSIDITGVAKIEDASAGHIAFLANPAYRRYLATTGASALLVAKDDALEELSTRSAPLTLVRVADPYVSFLTLIDRFTPQPAPVNPGIHPTAFISPGSTVHPAAAIGPFVFVGPGAIVEEGVTLHAGCVIGERVVIGKDSTFHPNVVVYAGCRFGTRAVVHAGTVIGSDGFGFAPTADESYAKIPQRGIVVVGDDVEIGANCTIDRATLGETRIGNGVKLDNLIQIAHNVVVGDHTVIAAQTGISGSTRLGHHSVVGGQVGMGGHLTIADHSTIAAQSGVTRSHTKPGGTYFGYPALEIQRARRIEGAVRQLPDLLNELRELFRRVEALEKHGQKKTSDPS